MKRWLKIFTVLMLSFILAGCGTAASQSSINQDSVQRSGTAEDNRLSKPEEDGGNLESSKEEDGELQKSADEKNNELSGEAAGNNSKPSENATEENASGTSGQSGSQESSGISGQPESQGSSGISGQTESQEGSGISGQLGSQEGSSTSESGEEDTLPEDGTYTSKEDVALYLHQYGCLPGNFITKKEAESLGWKGGSLEPYAPGMCIGGSRFGNYEGLLPAKEGRTYTECDIDTLGAEKRGAKRIVFSNDGLIYYTEDHYQSFELLYGEE